MKHYHIVFIFTAFFINPCSGMGRSLIADFLNQTPESSLRWAILLHNKSRLTKPVSILKKDAQGPNVICDIDLNFINGQPKSSREIEIELEFYIDQFHKKAPENTIRAPNNIWISCDPKFNTEHFSFNAEGKLMFNEKVLVEKNRNKKLQFGSFAGKSIIITQQKYPKSIYRATFKDWDDTRYFLYIDTRCNEITDYFPS